jgi:hypothetical protein
MYIYIYIYIYYYYQIFIEKVRIEYLVLTYKCLNEALSYQSTKKFNHDYYEFNK